MADPREVMEMTRLLNILDSGGAAPVTESASATATPSGDPNIAAMKVILQRLETAAASTVATLHEEAKTDRRLREALMTMPTDRGARIGDYQVVAHQDGKMKTYDVVGEAGDPIKVGLTLYEAAVGLVRILNHGGSLDGLAARELLTIEETYERGLADAIFFKHRYRTLEEKGDYTRAAIFEDRYDAARDRALDAKNRLRGMVGPIC